MEFATKLWKWFWVEQILVQILVVVANIQMRILKTEEGKGSMWTAFVHGLVAPKLKDNSLYEKIFFCWRKGMGLIFPNRDVDNVWQHNQSCRPGWKLRIEFSVLFNKSRSLELVYPEIGTWAWNQPPTSWGSGLFSTSLEKAWTRFISTLVRTYNRIRSPRFEASSQSNNVGKGSRQIRSVT